MTRPHNPCVQPVQPLSLRDHFAGQLVSSLFNDSAYSEAYEDIARRAYALADAMLAQRAKGETVVEAAPAPSAGVVWRPISEWKELQNDVPVLLWDSYRRKANLFTSLDHSPVWADYFAIITPPEAETAQQDQPASVQPERNAEHERLREVVDGVADALVSVADDIHESGENLEDFAASDGRTLRQLATDLIDALCGKEGSTHE